MYGTASSPQLFTRTHWIKGWVGTVQLKRDGTRWRTGGEVKGKLANGVGTQYSSHYLGTWCIQHYYRWRAHLGCQVVDLTDAPADLNGLVRFAERRNLVSARVPSHLKRSLPQLVWKGQRTDSQPQSSSPAWSLERCIINVKKIWFREKLYLLFETPKDFYFRNTIVCYEVLVFAQFLGAFSKLQKVTISFVMSVRSSVRPHGTTRLPLGGFSWNLIFE